MKNPNSSLRCFRPCWPFQLSLSFGQGRIPLPLPAFVFSNTTVTAEHARTVSAESFWSENCRSPLAKGQRRQTESVEFTDYAKRTYHAWSSERCANPSANFSASAVPPINSTEYCIERKIRKAIAKITVEPISIIYLYKTKWTETCRIWCRKPPSLL